MRGYRVKMKKGKEVLFDKTLKSLSSIEEAREWAGKQAVYIGVDEPYVQIEEAEYEDEEK